MAFMPKELCRGAYLGVPGEAHDKELTSKALQHVEATVTTRAVPDMNGTKWAWILRLQQRQ